ncbi:LysR family transcriptional regulator [soil metagenome]
MRARQFSIATLDTICWIARLGSFTAAAERLHTTQPAISARVRELEAAIGVKIFQRQGRGVELTIEGREFVRKAEPLLEQLEDLAESMQGPEGASGLIRIGIGNITMSWFPQLVSRLRTIMPQLKFEVQVERAGKLLESLEARRLDVAVTSGPIDVTKFSHEALGYDRMLWVVSRTVLDQAGTSDPATLFAQLPIWCVPRASFYTREAVVHLARFGVEPDEVDVIDNMAAQMEMILQGGGIGLLSQAMIRSHLAEGMLVALANEAQPVDPVPMNIVYLKEDAPHRVVKRIVEEAVTASTLPREPHPLQGEPAAGSGHD